MRNKMRALMAMLAVVLWLQPAALHAQAAPSELGGKGLGGTGLEPQGLHESPETPELEVDTDMPAAMRMDAHEVLAPEAAHEGMVEHPGEPVPHEPVGAER